MRHKLSLQDGWFVSVFPEDAAFAATHATWEASDLTAGDDPENHPQAISLPGSPALGKRPLTVSGSAGEPPGAKPLPDGMTLITRNAAGERLPNPFLSYARQIDIPADWAEQTIFLHLDQVRYHVTVQLDGEVIAHYLGGLEPHRIDVTDHLKPGRKSLLSITVGDSGTSGHRRFDAYNYTGTRLPSCAEISDNLVHPVNYGGANRGVGKVSLEAVPKVRVAWVMANPKVSLGLLRYTVVLANETNRAARVKLRSDAVGARCLVAETVTIPANSERSLTWDIPWPDAILWDTDNPHLYDLLTTLHRGATALDVHTETFGFREFTIDGDSFYLNGKKIHLFNQSGHSSPDEDMLLSLADKEAMLRAWKEQGNVNHIRLHAKPQDRGWVEAADRVGMLITTETALWTTNYYSFDWVGSEEACYENVRQHFLEALVRRDRNSPSVILWSLSNEMSPITPFDLEIPKMAAMTRCFERILAEARAEDDSRVIQMSSAMDFVGRLAVYNLHYPKNWQAFPDYPHTAYWLDGSFLFPWYGPRRQEMPSWSWRHDKPLLFGEFTCVFGATPDCQAAIVGDVAFACADGGTALVNEKLWPMEMNAYRRQDVSGFCAWACMYFHDLPGTLKRLQEPHVQAHTYALRPLAVLDHGYRTRWFGGDEIAMPLSLHNDTRHDRELSLRCEVLDEERRVLWSQEWPAARYAPAESRAFASRYCAPRIDTPATLTWRATLRSGVEIVDRWEKSLELTPRQSGPSLPADTAFYDPDGALAERFAARGIVGGRFLAELDDASLAGCRSLWLHVGFGKLSLYAWRQQRDRLTRFVAEGGCLLLDDAPPAFWEDLPIALANGQGYAADERLEITYAYVAAPLHPAMAGLGDEDFRLWGEDYYVARRCLEVPQEGNAVPLLVAGTDRRGLTSSPLLELAHGRGSFVVSTLQLMPKLLDEPKAAGLVARLAAYRPVREARQVAVQVSRDSLRMLREVGYAGPNAMPVDGADTVIADGACVEGAGLAALVEQAKGGATVYLHDLGEARTRELLSLAGLPGEMCGGKAGRREYDTFRHTDPLADGMTDNYLYWIVGKAKLAAWTPAQLHPEPASALIVEPGDGRCLTRRGAVVVYDLGRGRLVIDNLRWQLPDFDEPERPRRYVMTLMTNLGLPLAQGAAKRLSEEFETEAERRERGHF